MKSSKRAISTMIPLFLGMALMFIGNGLVISSGSVELAKIGVDELAIGVVNTCFFVGALISTLFSQRIVAQTGHIRAFAIFASIFGVAAMLHSFSFNLYFWGILRGFLGFCYYGLLMVIESWLNAKAPNGVRSRVISFYEAVFYISFGTGILIMALELDAFKIFIISAAFIMLSSIPLNLIRINQPPLPQKQAFSWPQIFSIVPLALVASLVAGVLVNGFFSMAGLFVMTQGYAPKEASFFMTIAMMGGFSAQLFIGFFSDKFGRRPAIILVCFVALVSCLLFLFSRQNLNFQYILAFFLGSGVFCLYGLAIARANDRVSDKRQSVQVARALLFSYSLASFISPILMGAMMKYFGSFGFIYVYITLLSVLITFAFFNKNTPLRKVQDIHAIRTEAMGLDLKE